MAAAESQAKSKRREGTRFIDKIMTHMELGEQLGQFLLEKADKNEIANPAEFCTSLVREFLGEAESDVDFEAGLCELVEGQRLEILIKLAFSSSNKAIESIVVALENSGNGQILEEACELLENPPKRARLVPGNQKALVQVEDAPMAAGAAVSIQVSPVRPMKVEDTPETPMWKRYQKRLEKLTTESREKHWEKNRVMGNDLLDEDEAE